MKTAKEITEFLVKERDYNKSAQRHLLLIITHEEGYRYKVDALMFIREFMLRYEYFPDKETAMKGIEDALKWVLKEEEENDSM